MVNEDNKYLRDAQKVDYGVRSLFFHRDIKGRNYEEFLKKISSLKADEYDWQNSNILEFQKRHGIAQERKRAIPYFYSVIQRQ